MSTMTHFVNFKNISKLVITETEIWCPMRLAKGQLILKANFLFSFEPKIELIYFLISALASKKSSNQKTVFYKYVNYPLIKWPYDLSHQCHCFDQKNQQKFFKAFCPSL